MSASATLTLPSAENVPADDDMVGSMLETLEFATCDNREHPARAGNIVALSTHDADEVLVTADLHGHRRNFRTILRVADLDRHPRRHLVLQEVCHGGPKYPGGGCRSHAMLEAVARLKEQYPGRVHFLLSNHELAEVTDYPIGKNGNILLVSFRMGIHTVYGERATQILEAYKRFIRSCPLAVYLPGGAFISHSTPEAVDRRQFDLDILGRELSDADLDVEGPAGQLVWGRDYRWPNAERFADLVEARVLIHGHTPCFAGYAVPNPRQVILDCVGRPASMALLPVGPPLDRDEVVRRILVLR